MAACEEHGVKTAVAHRRANPYEEYGKKLVDEGVIGQLQVLRSHGKSDRRAGSQDLMVLGTHMMDSMRYFAGAEVVWAHGHVTQDGREVDVGRCAGRGRAHWLDRRQWGGGVLRFCEWGDRAF